MDVTLLYGKTSSYTENMRSEVSDFIDSLSSKIKKQHKEETEIRQR